MPLTREIEKTDYVNFIKPMRAIFSGSSQSGKTNLIGNILSNQHILFGDNFTLVKYFYPEYLEECPVEWHKEIDTPISYEPGFPNKEDILSLPNGSLLIIDDNMKKVVHSELIRQLYNVISGKRNISVISVTQNYFTQGPFSRDIRNSSNYVALFRNCADASLNKRVATAFGLGKAYNAAECDIFQKEVYPYVFIDQTQKAQLSSYRVFVDILSDIKVAYNTNGMKGFILNENDFAIAFKIIQEKNKTVTAVVNEDTSESIQSSDRSNPKPKAIKRKSKKRKITKQKQETAENKQTWRKYT